MHSSYPDLLSFRSQQGSQTDRTSIRRSSSLQDISSLERIDTKNKKLKPILRGSEAKNASENHDKGTVKFGQREVHLIKDSRLPPIEAPAQRKTAGLPVNGEDDLNLPLGLSPRNHKRPGPECSPDIFPRGQPVEVKKPATPTYDDYPDIYWELRSATVQDPSDLKEDMIDRDRYRLQQISSLRLRAMNREVAAKRLDCYRKWQQQMREHSPPPGPSGKQDSARSSATISSNASAVSAKAGKQKRMSMPIDNHTLAVAAKSISPNMNPTSKKKTENNNSPQLQNAVQINGSITENELRRRQKIEAAAKADNGVQEAKQVKAAVVNLCIDPDSYSSTPTSDVYTGIRRVMFGARPLSSRYKTFISSLGGQDQRLPTAAQESMSGVSMNAVLGSSQSHRLYRVPSAPIAEVSMLVACGTSGDLTDRETDTGQPSKMILRKFNRLQVFSEKGPGSETTSADPRDELLSRPSDSKSPYLPLSRPPTYKLDTKYHPPLRHGSAGFVHCGGGDSGGSDLLYAEGQQGGIPLIPPSERAETSSLTIRFSNGEVIVSRQGKKPTATE